YSYIHFFAPPLDASKLPCLVLFNDLEDRQAVVRPLPDWDRESLLRLLQGMFAVIHRAITLPKAKQLAYLERNLTSPRSYAKSYFRYGGRQVAHYLHHNPAKIVWFASTILVSLATGNVLPLVANPTILEIIRA